MVIEDAETGYRNVNGKIYMSDYRRKPEEKA